MFDGDGRVCTVVLAQLVEMLDQVVGHPSHGHSVVAGEQQCASVHDVVRVVHDREQLAVVETVHGLGCAVEVTDTSHEEQRHRVVVRGALGRCEHLDAVGRAGAVAASEHLEGIRVDVEVEAAEVVGVVGAVAGISRFANIGNSAGAS